MPEQVKRHKPWKKKKKKMMRMMMMMMMILMKGTTQRYVDSESKILLISLS
jgi:hypothetical protein